MSVTQIEEPRMHAGRHISAEFDLEIKTSFRQRRGLRKGDKFGGRAEEVLHQ